MLRGRLAGVVVTGALAAGALTASGCAQSCDFDGAAWRSAPDGFADRFDTMHPLASTLQDCPDILRGKTKREVLQLLGPPTFKTPGGRYFNYSIGVPEGQSDWQSSTVPFVRGRVDAASGWDDDLPEV